MRFYCCFELRTGIVVTFVILHTEDAEERLDLLMTSRQAILCQKREGEI